MLTRSEVTHAAHDKPAAIFRFDLLATFTYGKPVPNLTKYAEMAATEYLQETGETELNSRWIAEFFQDCGVQDDYPQQDLIAFHAMVQKALLMQVERAGKQARSSLDKVIHFAKTTQPYRKKSE